MNYLLKKKKNQFNVFTNISLQKNGPSIVGSSQVHQRVKLTDLLDFSVEEHIIK